MLDNTDYSSVSNTNAFDFQNKIVSILAKQEYEENASDSQANSSNLFPNLFTSSSSSNDNMDDKDDDTRGINLVSLLHGPSIEKAQINEQNVHLYLAALIAKQNESTETQKEKYKPHNVIINAAVKNFDYTKEYTQSELYEKDFYTYYMLMPKNLHEITTRSFKSNDNRISNALIGRFNPQSLTATTNVSDFDCLIFKSIFVLFLICFIDKYAL